MKKLDNFAFIDSQNLNLGIRSQGWKIDFQRFRIYLKDKFKVKKAFLFLGYVKENEKLYTKLKSYGYEIIFKPTFKTKKGEIKGNVDAELVLQTMIEINNYEKAVIVSGDGDFYCLIKYLDKENKLEKLVIPNKKKYSYFLNEFSKSKKIIFLSGDGIKNKIRKK